MPDVYSSGASFQGGALKVTDAQKVDNLNAEKLQGETPDSFIKTASAASSASGISQSGNNLTMSDEIVQFTGSGSKVKFGNIVIKASSDGDGILIGIENND